MFSLEAIIQVAALAVTAAIGICVLYSIFQMRAAYIAQQEKFERVIAALKQFSKMLSDRLAHMARRSEVRDSVYL